MNEENQHHFERAAECIEDMRILLGNDRFATVVEIDHQVATQILKRTIYFVDTCRRLTP